MHVVYYQTMLNAVELVEIMKHTSKQSFICEGVYQLVDQNVHKLVAGNDGRGGTLKFRHILSIKITTVNDKDSKYEDNKVNRGFIMNNTKPSKQIIQVIKASEI